MRIRSQFLATLAVASALSFVACNKSATDSGGGAARIVNITVKGSDTMVQLAGAWEETYRKVKPNVRINVNGGGSGTGFAALQNNTTDMCDASREIKKEEAEKVKVATGKEPKQFMIGYD